MLKEQITRADAGVIYKAYKQGQIEMSREEANRMYGLVDYDGYDDNGSMSAMADRLLVAAMEIREGNFKSANENIRRAFGEKKETKVVDVKKAAKIEEAENEIKELEAKAKTAKWSEKKAIYSEIECLEKYVKRMTA